MSALSIPLVLLVLLILGFIAVLLMRFGEFWSLLAGLLLAAAGSIWATFQVWERMLAVLPFHWFGSLLALVLAACLVAAGTHYLGVWSFGKGDPLWLVTLELMWAYWGVTAVTLYAGHYAALLLPGIAIGGPIALMVVVYLVGMIVNLFAALFADPDALNEDRMGP